MPAGTGPRPHGHLVYIKISCNPIPSFLNSSTLFADPLALGFQDVSSSV